ncbi:MAG: DUF4430 domain-containing protein [Clostridia bacterium]|nr:DUF4430 domain-containing protein [Clostridia bacterium]
MIKRFLSAVLVLLLLLGAVPCAAAQTDGVRCEEIQQHIERILAYELDRAGVSELQALLDGRLSERAGIDAEWYAIALSQYDGALSLDAYADALERYLAEHRANGASTRQKYALALIAAGRENTALVRDALSDSIGQQGIMSLVFGLHLLNLGLPSEDYTADGAVDALLARRLSDGGYAVSGEVANADVTAMALQALAPHRARSDVQTAIEQALVCLSDMQHADGSFESYGASNAESCAQVVMALCALGIDPFADERFIQEGHTVVDALLGFANAEGGYAHRRGEAVSVSATAQALCALVSLRRAEMGQPFLYLFEGASYDPSTIPDTPAVDPAAPEPPSTDARLWVCLGIGMIALIGAALLLLIKKKKGVRDACLAIVVAGLAVVLVLTVRVQTPEEYYGAADETGKVIGAVTLEIRCDSVAGLDDHIPTDGAVLSATEVVLCEGDSAYDVLLRAARQHRILVEAHGGTVGDSSSRYVRGINNLYEFDFGELSGWVYTVNGVHPSRGCDAYILEDADRVSFLYTTTLGENVGGEVTE